MRKRNYYDIQIGRLIIHTNAVIDMFYDAIRLMVLMAGVKIFITVILYLIKMIISLI